jgi:hypothetical protein
MVLCEHYAGEMKENHENISHSYPRIKHSMKKKRVQSAWFAQSLINYDLKRSKTVSEGLDTS